MEHGGVLTAPALSSLQKARAIPDPGIWLQYMENTVQTDPMKKGAR